VVPSTTNECNTSAMNRWKRAKATISVVSAFKRSSKYKTEGNKYMDSPAIKYMRERLRQSAQIKGVVDRFWTAVDMIKDPDSGKVTRDSYIELNVKLQKVIICRSHAYSTRMLTPSPTCPRVYAFLTRARISAANYQGHGLGL
jgi:hypothetical protein